MILNHKPYPEQGQTIACRRCGLLAQHAIAPGRGIHHAELCCEACGSHLKWLSAKTPEERVACAAHHRDEYMASIPPTDKQIKYLQHLGHVGDLPQNRLAASRLIDNLVRRRGDQ